MEIPNSSTQVMSDEYTDKDKKQYTIGCSLLIEIENKGTQNLRYTSSNGSGTIEPNSIPHKFIGHPLCPLKGTIFFDYSLFKEGDTILIKIRNSVINYGE
ncbi:hypothetical protein [Aureispira sp. CCB-E]|uniref:hypothetical protein n=1 Tax=Aureispira sp. CCB-E TaxID=3051121 RepID=UPI0028687CED|nr:hypothetical protein [Aureispira sp. CCB-E]WMX12302.1 hypothetical protein QP953_15850 [Aureispira sp. CCB-E]